MIEKQKYDITAQLAKIAQENRNPIDLKSVKICKVEQIEPVIVSSDEGKILYKEDEELLISEWFRLRCNIDKTKSLSESVINNCSSAEGIKEIHSQSGTQCNMPQAIEFLSLAIKDINTELLSLKCDLKIGDLVAIASLEQDNKFLLIDKVL